MSFSTCEAVSIDTRQRAKKPADVNSIELIVSLYINLQLLVILFSFDFEQLCYELFNM